MFNSISRHLPRQMLLLIITAALIVMLAFVAPQQLTVALYKITLVSLAAFAGYWLDRALFPYARPDSFLNDDWRRTRVDEFGSVGAVDYPFVSGCQHAYAASMIRRAIIIFATVIGVALGL